MSLEVRPATADLWDDVRTVLQPKKSAHTCWCMAWRLTTGEYGRMTAEERGEHLRTLTEKADPPPGVLGFLDGEVAGWCNVAPRRRLDRLTASKTITPVDDLPVWSVTCFVVRKEHRGKGVASGLLEGAVEHARAHGAPAVEAIRWTRRRPGEPDPRLRGDHGHVRACRFPPGAAHRGEERQAPPLDRPPRPGLRPGRRYGEGAPAVRGPLPACGAGQGVCAAVSHNWAGRPQRSASHAARR